MTTYAEYDALPGDRWSDLSQMYEGPRWYRLHMDEPDDGTDAMDLGGFIHTLVLEPERELLEYAIWPTENGKRVGNKWTAFQAEHAGKTIIREVDKLRAYKVRDAVRSHPEAAELLAADGGEREVTIQWTDPDTGRPCKARIDLLIPSGRLASFNDLKTTGKKLGNLKAFRWGAADLLYHGQAGMYRDGLQIARGLDLGANIIVAQTDGAFEVAVLRFSSNELWAGSDLFHDMLGKVAWCEARGSWPFAHEEIEDLDLPPWTPGLDELEVEMTTP